jgi:predicted DNA-binding protein
MEVATVRLHLDTIQRVDKQAIRLGITANKIKREAIEEKLAKLERSVR